MDGTARFEAHINPAKSQALVGGATVFGGVCLLGGLLLVNPILVLLALAAFALALFNYPHLRENEPLLVVSPRGLKLDGLGLIRWSSVISCGLDDEVAPGKRSTRLRCKLLDTMPNSLRSEDEDGMIRRIQVRVWKFEPPDFLIIELGPMKEDPQDVFQAILHYVAPI